MPSEINPRALTADEERLLRFARLLSRESRNAMLVEAGKRLTIECIPEVRAASEAQERAKGSAHGEQSREAAMADAESAMNDAFDEFFSAHLPDFGFHGWAFNMECYYGRHGFYEEVLRKAFEGEVAEVMFGSQDADENHAGALNSTIEYEIEANNLGSSNPYFIGKWDLPDEKLVEFIRDWPAAVTAALMERPAMGCS